jgi:hypothetical protein
VVLTTFRLQYTACHWYNGTMAALTFDTHFFVKKLTKDGIPVKQAESIVEFVRETREADLSAVATKGDLRELELRLKTDMTNQKIELIKWFIGSLFLQAGLIVTLIKLSH